MQNDDPKLGRKFDSGKPRMGLLPPYALEAIAKVLTLGADKYAPSNWKYVEGREWRYFDAMLRHINSHSKGEMNDPESGLPHLAHAGCCLMFLLDELETSSAKENIGGSSANNIPVSYTITTTDCSNPVGKDLTTSAARYSSAGSVDIGTGVTGIVR